MHADDSLPALARAQHERGARGDFRGSAELTRRLHAVGEPGWAGALGAQAWLAGAEGAPPTDALGAGEGAVYACSHAQRIALLAFEGLSVAQWADRAERASGGEAPGWVALSRAWAELVAGRHERVHELGAFAVDDAKRRSDAPLAIEGAVVRAVAALLRDDLEEATTIARRASRMARTESLPQQEYLANAVLARVRRLQGNSPLATRILTALLRVASPPWRPWLVWELLLASGDGAPRPAPPEGRGANAVRSLARMLVAAREADRSEYDRARTELEAAVSEHALFARDAEILRWATDVEAGAIEDAPDRLRAWLAGSDDEAPDGLHGLAPAGSPETAAVVAPGPGAAPPRRSLSVALPLAVVSIGARVLEPSDNRQARTDSMIAALLLCGAEGSDEDRLFRAIYGFAYDAAIHAGVRDVLYHRVRARLGEIGSLERDAGRVWIDHREPLVAYDPRCSPPPEHSLLQLLAQAGHLTAKQAAEILGMPVRTAQHTLRKLAEDGACRAERDGRRMEYHLEDTTFMEPTGH